MPSNVASATGKKVASATIAILNGSSMPRKITKAGTKAMTGTCQAARTAGASAASATRDKAMHAPNASPAPAPIA